mmetsp:Transcript_1626/g.3553  ORF Transcript_1626/g.3553 Transcript_1626/m.3553 type:complete len:187 (+) Transcript_1626:131-691(+)
MANAPWAVAQLDPRREADPTWCTKPRNRSLFWPNGPLTARNLKTREHLFTKDTLQKPLVWNKSGPPTHEERMQKGERAAPLLDANAPARVAARNIVALRRDLNEDFGPKTRGISTLLEPNQDPMRAHRHREMEHELKDLSDVELMELVGTHGLADKRANLSKAIATLNKHRCLDDCPGPITTQALP